MRYWHFCKNSHIVYVYNIKIILDYKNLLKCCIRCDSIVMNSVILYYII